MGRMSCPRLWTVGRHRCHPDPLLVLGKELQLLAQLEVSTHSSAACINPPLTHSPLYPFNSHIVKTVHTSLLFPAKEGDTSPHSVLPDWSRERGQGKRIDFMISCPSFWCVFHHEVQFFLKPNGNYFRFKSIWPVTLFLCVEVFIDLPLCSCLDFLLLALWVLRVCNLGHGCGVSVCVLWRSCMSWLPAVLALGLTVYPSRVDGFLSEGKFESAKLGALIWVQ